MRTSLSYISSFIYKDAELLNIKKYITTPVTITGNSHHYRDYIAVWNVTDERIKSFA